MSAKNRADLINKLYKVAKKEYDFIKPPSNRTVFENMLYGCCLENSTFEAADEAFAKLQENFCDWNEVRVTTLDELAESGKTLAIRWNVPPASSKRSTACLKNISPTIWIS